MSGEPMRAAGTKVTVEQYEQLRWLAYDRDTTVSAIIASYVVRCLPEEDLSRMPQREAE